jgi:hypothetical protein
MKYEIFRTFDNEGEALQFMQDINRARLAASKTDIVVLVDGPDDGEYTVMELADAVDGGFAYRWEI